MQISKEQYNKLPDDLKQYFYREAGGKGEFESQLKYVDAGTRKLDGKSVFESSTTEIKNVHPTL